MPPEHPAGRLCQPVVCKVDQSLISTVEGALVRCPTAGDPAPLDPAIVGLKQALDGLLALR